MNRTGSSFAIAGLLASFLALSAFAAGAQRDVSQSGILPSDNEDRTDQLAQILAGGSTDLYFPPGVYLIGSLALPANTKIEFAPGAMWKVNPARIADKVLLKIVGNGVVLERLNFDFRGTEGEDIRRDVLKTIVAAEGVEGLSVRSLSLNCTSPWQENGRQKGFVGVNLNRCRNVEIAGCSAKNIVALVHSVFTANLVVRDNRMDGGRYITAFKNGSEYLKHYGNWSANVTDQVCWWGGDANDSKDTVERGSATQVERGVGSADPGYDPNTAGAFDILVTNNYAENGRTLAWGAKGREVIVSGNIARFMSDMAYDSEGSEKVIFSDNISINSQAAGIGCYFWSESVIISNNIIIVDSSVRPDFAGDFIRLHSLGGRTLNESGSGNILITGNLFSARVDDRLRLLSIEASRGVTISNNHFVNGRIETRQREIARLSVQDNEFLNRLFPRQSTIEISAGVNELSVSGNSLRQQPLSKEASTEQKTAPAISIAFTGKGLKRIERNALEGWETSLSARRQDSGDSTARLLLRDNLVSGILRVDDAGAPLTLHSSGNLNVKTLEAVEVKKP